MTGTKIFKYTLNATDTQRVKMYREAQILSVQVQHGEICVWARVNPSAPTLDVDFDIFGTGHPIPADYPGTFIGTVQWNGGALVWHVFYRNLDPK